MAKETDFTIDMTDIQELGVLPADRAYLFSISKWEYGKSASNANKVSIRMAVKEPEEFAKRIVFEELSLENQFTKGRFLQLLKATLGKTDEELRQKNFKPPTQEDMLGLELTGWVRIESNEQYGDRNRINRVAPATVFAEQGAY